MAWPLLGTGFLACSEWYVNLTRFSIHFAFLRGHFLEVARGNFCQLGFLLEPHKVVIFYVSLAFVQSQRLVVSLSTVPDWQNIVSELGFLGELRN
ncbi:hypothetical protein BCD64_02725 [Nostoc sp. MBR 210]|nr:hypothetical protein BCD64_02725 [Nostoc sp. MBR 210]